MATIEEIRAQKCGNCRFGEWAPHTDRGYCVRYPPTMVSDSQEGGADSYWARVRKDNWCGEWREE